jgi:hypothetical protein
MPDNLSIAVTADTSELRAQLALAQADLRAFGAETRKLATDIRAGGDASGQLRAELERVATSFAGAKSQVAGLTKELSEHKGGIEGVKGALQSVGAPLAALTGGLGGIAAALGVAFAAEIIDRVREFASSMAELGEHSLNAAAALGLSVPKYAQLASALQLAGADGDTARRALERLAVSLVEASSNPASKAAVAFRNIGFTQAELQKSSKDLGVALDTLAEKFADAEAGPQRTAAMADILSRRLLDALIPALRQGGAGMEELRAKSAPAADTFARFIPLAADTKEKINALVQAAAELSQKFFTALKPAIDTVSDGATWLINRLKDLIDWFGRVATAANNAAAAIARVFGSGTTTGLSAAEAGGVEVPLPPVEVTAKRPVGTETAGGHKGGRGRAAKAETDDSEAIALERLANEQKVDDQILDRRTKLIEATKAAGKISLDSEYALLVANLEQKQKADQGYYQEKIAAAQGDEKEQQKILAEEQTSYQEYLTKRQELDIKYFEARKAAEQKAAADSKAAWDKVLAPLTSSFDTAIKGFIQGTTTLQQALKRAFETVLLDPLLKNLTNGLKTALMSAFSGSDVANSFIGKFFSGTLFGGATSTTGIAALGTASSSAAAEVAAFGTAAAAATARLGAGGVAGGAGAAAGVAGAASGGGGFFGWLGGLLGFAHGGIVPSAQGGWALPALGPGGVLARLHSQEMVLPANISQMLQGMARGGGSGTVNYSPTIDARGSQMTTAQFNSLLTRSHSELSGLARNAVRNGWRP